MSTEADGLVDAFRWQARACRQLGSTFYGDLVDALADDLGRGGVVRDVMAGHLDAPTSSFPALRLLGPVHREVLAGRADALAAHYPSTGGDGDASAAVAPLLALLGERPATVRPRLDTPPQTNEVGRSAPLFGALLAARPRQPVRLFELGASGGLNLLADRWRYEAAEGAGWGDPAARVVLRDAWNRTPGSGPVVVVERRGCDPAPLDLVSEDGALTVMGYCWPDQHERLARLRGAIATLREEPVDVVTTTAADFLAGLDVELGALTVVWHSVMWLYVPAEEQERAGGELARLHGSASGAAPFLHVAFEPHRLPEEQAAGDPARADFRITVTDEHGARVVGTAAPHGIPTTFA